MFDLVANIKKRDIIGLLTLPDFVESIRNPDHIRKSQVDFARTLDRKSEKYSVLKCGLPSIVFNFSHDSYVSGSTVVNPTGFLYLDIDNVESINLSEIPYVVSFWKSLSNKGFGILLSVKGLTVTNYKEVTKKLGDELGIEIDTRAISIDRLCVLSYDKDIYYNEFYSTYEYKECLKVIKDKVSFSNIKTNNIIGCERTNLFEDTKYRYTNLQDKISDIDFNGEPFIDLGDNKICYSEVYIPIVTLGNRNTVMFSVLSQFYGLNNWINISQLTSWAQVVNEDRFKPPLEKSELLNIVKNVFNQDAPKIILNKTKRILFNPDYNFSVKERRSLSVNQIAKIRRENTISKMFKIINDWDFENFGKIDQISIVNNSDMSMGTVKRWYRYIKDSVKILNLDYKNLDNK